MILEVLAAWVEVIQNWDGEDGSKLTAFIATISDALKEDDDDSVYAMVQELQRYEFDDSRICVRCAL